MDIKFKQLIYECKKINYKFTFILNDKNYIIEQ